MVGPRPAERLWPLTDEALANKAFDSLDSSLYLT
jgi:hypothetical protein